VQTPRFWGLRLSAGLLLLMTLDTRDLRTSWLTVGIVDGAARGRNQTRAERAARRAAS
jgi:hypothetical protein